MGLRDRDGRNDWGQGADRRDRPATRSASLHRRAAYYDKIVLGVSELEGLQLDG